MLFRSGKAEMYAEEVKKVLGNKKKIMLAEERMGTMVQDRIKEVLGLPEILDRNISVERERLFLIWFKYLSGLLKLCE